MFRDELQRHAARLPALSERQISLLERHFELLLRWNKVLNLSAVRSEAEIVERHYCESLFLAGHLTESVPGIVPAGLRTIADLGSGAGFPGFPIAVVHPDWEVILIESHKRKAVFLQEASRDLSNVRVITNRAEEIILSVDWVVSRAVNVAGLKDWLQVSAERIALLTAGEPVDLPGFQWEARTPVPWGDRRFLDVGRNVSRETSDYVRF